MFYYPYLNDKKFLKVFDTEVFREHFIKITVLDFVTEQPISSIEGKATGGTCNLSGTSNMRRTANCSLIVDPDFTNTYNNIMEVENLISINKKINLEIGLTNTLQTLQDYNQYSIYDILWFPLGVYVIKNASISKNNGGINISLTLNDKCALLNGDIGGIIPAQTILSELQIVDSNTTEKLLIKDIIKHIVHEFGGEPEENILISDIPDTIKKVVKWADEKNKLYHYRHNLGDFFLLNDRVFQDDNKPDPLEEFIYGQDIGYIEARFEYPGTLECNAGESVASVLDKIKNTLGNFEWFYDINGKFIFQEKKNYINNTISTNISQINALDYQINTNLSTSVYTFDENNKQIVISISNSPQFPNIKNDFIVWGVMENSSGAQKSIRYHLAFDKKPESLRTEIGPVLVYVDDRKRDVVVDINNPKIIENFPETGEEDKFYYNSKGEVFKWDSTERAYLPLEKSKAEICYLSTSDWRTQLFFDSVLNQSDVIFQENPYSAELLSEWTGVYNVRASRVGSYNSYSIYEGDFREESTYTFWLDFIEGADIDVNSIGRRTKVESDNKVNCIFATPIPLFSFAEADGLVSEKSIEGTELVQVSSDIYSKMVIGGGQNSAFDRIKDMLYTYTNYNEAINLTIIPIYYLEPNTRISIIDSDIGVKGDYIIKSISLPLTFNGTSNISATKNVEKAF